MRKTLRITLDVLVSDLSPAERAETVDEFNPTPLPGLRSRDISARAIADLIEGAIPVSSDEAFAGQGVDVFTAADDLIAYVTTGEHPGGEDRP